MRNRFVLLPFARIQVNKRFVFAGSHWYWEEQQVPSKTEAKILRFDTIEMSKTLERVHIEGASTITRSNEESTRHHITHYIRSSQTP